MRSNRQTGLMIALLSFAVVASSFHWIPTAQAGPISEMLAKHRQNRQLKLPPMEPPFSKKPIKDLNVTTASFSSRLKKRFSFKKDATSGVIPFQDSNVNKTSR